MKSIQEMIAVMQAYDEGKKIEYFAYDNPIGGWTSKFTPTWDWYKFNYRIKQDKLYKLGDRFIREGNEYILAQPLTNKVCLISLINGNRWEEPYPVENVSRITEEEFSEIRAGSFFELIE